jgi:hypothetical protein
LTPNFFVLSLPPPPLIVNIRKTFTLIQAHYIPFPQTIMFSKLAVAALLLTSVANAATCNRQYTVKAGDTCDSIGAANNASTYQLLTIWSPTVDSECSNLKVGAQLCLGYAGEDCSNTYVVQSGDTCGQVAQNHGLNSTILNLNNPQLDDQCSNLYIGEVICVSNTVQVPQANGAVPTAIPTTATAATAHTTQTHAQTQTQTAQTQIQTGGSDDGDNGDDGDENLPYCDEL